ncbi:MAG: zinc ribbon domain-containing protein [Bdellovibrionota bacterium]
MVLHFAAAKAATTVRLRCPHCGKEQERQRKPKGTAYRCQDCRKLFVPGKNKSHLK